MAKKISEAHTAHAELDRLRGLAADERVKARDLAHRLDVARDKSARAEEAIDAGYEAEDEQAISAAREALRNAELEADDVARRTRAAEAKVLTAQQFVDRYVEQHADDLIAEEVARAEDVAQRLTAAVREALGLHH